MNLAFPSPRLLRTRLLLLTIITLLPVFALCLAGVLNQRKIEKKLVEDRLLADARLTALAQKGVFEKSRQILASWVGIPFLSLATNGPLASAMCVNIRLIAPDYLNFGIVETNGTLFCNAAQTNRTDNLSGRSWFQRIMQSHSFVLGDFEPDPLVAEPCVNFAFPILDLEGKFKRIFFASMKLSTLQATVEDLPRLERERMTVIDDRGWVLARCPDPEHWSGKAAASEPEYLRGRIIKQGIFEETGLSGTRRLFATQAVPADYAQGIRVFVSLPRDDSFAEANASLGINLAAMAIITVLALWLALAFCQRLILKPIAATVGAANRLAAGDFSARTGVGDPENELGKLALAFDAMAANLEGRQRELEQAHAEVKQINAVLEKRVTERTAQLEAVNQELEAFSYSVSHDLRAPLRHISGFVDLLGKQEAMQREENAKRYLGFITSAARQMGMLVDDLLAFSRMGRSEMTNSRVDLQELALEVKKDLASAAGTRTIEWHLALPEIQADPAMMRLVLANLFSNAIKYSAPRAVAKIEAGYVASEKEITIFVRDNGVGFDMKYVHKLFGVFQRLHRADEFEGTGIGLANIQRIIHRHGGKAWAEGKVDGGATFYFSIPRQPKPG